jgi:hypothetical protein
MDVSLLPRQLHLELGAVRCEYCGRGWRLPASGLISEASFSYLCDHVDDHVRATYRRVAPSWSELKRRHPGL